MIREEMFERIIGWAMEGGYDPSFWAKPELGIFLDKKFLVAVFGDEWKDHVFNLIESEDPIYYVYTQKAKHI